MTFDNFITHCESKKGTEQTLPFGPNTLVLKVGNKMYAICDLNEFKSINLKCDPEKAIELRELYPAVIPGYHMNKVHWNTVEMDGSIPDKLIKKWIDDSYDLIVASLPKKS
jgi:predicted DNA-binding protein (MmcQ/YjbR family)